jgi:hypothetical protein
MNDHRPKLIYVAQRHPRYTHEDFIRRWRQHAALGMSQARWRNVAMYLHCDRIGGLPGTVPTIDCDGVAVVVYRSEDARQAHLADEPARRTMKHDELDTFAQPVAKTSLLLREETEQPGPLDGFRLFVFWSAASGAPITLPAPALQHWQPLSVGFEVGLARNHPAGRIAEWECACVDELTSARLEPLCALAARRANERQASGEVRFVLTRTVVLHNAPAV